MAVSIGTSGWSYDHWVGVLYPKSAKSLERLDAYARHFKTVEVNNTFYRWPKDEVFSTWRERSPDGFVFSAKASRGLTQFRNLNDPVPWLERMEAGLSRLGEKRGVTLCQLPPHFPRDATDCKATEACNGESDDTRRAETGRQLPRHSVCQKVNGFPTRPLRGSI